MGFWKFVSCIAGGAATIVAAPVVLSAAAVAGTAGIAAGVATGAGILAVSKLGKSFVDNVIKDKVLPESGCIVYCALAFGGAEHTGVYIGNNQIVELNGDGRIIA